MVEGHKKAFQKQYEKARKEAQRAGLLPVRSSGGLVPMQNLVLDHFRVTLRPGHMYELTAEASKLLRSVGETLSGLHHHAVDAAPAEPRELEAGGDGDAVDAVDAAPEEGGDGDGDGVREGIEVVDPWDGLEEGGGGTTPEAEIESPHGSHPPDERLAPEQPAPPSPALDHDAPMVLEDDMYTAK